MFPVFQRFGGLEQTLLVLKRRRGKALTISAVRSWKEEGRVPAINRLPLMEEAAERGIVLDERDFLPEVPVRPRKPKRGRGRQVPKTARRSAPVPNKKLALKTSRKRRRERAL